MIAVAERGSVDFRERSRCIIPHQRNLGGLDPVVSMRGKMTTNTAANTLVHAPPQPCVLVVEDEFLIRLLISDALRDAGYTVIEAANGDEAVEIIRTGIPLDLVFSDVRMPGSVDGLALVEFVKKSGPLVPVLLASGHCDPALARNAGADHFVRKPYEVDALIELVREKLSPSK